MWRQRGGASSAKTGLTGRLTSSRRFSSGWGDHSLESLYMRGKRRSAPAARQSGPGINDRFRSALHRSAETRSVRRWRLAVRDHARLWPYIWPADRRDLQMRVALAMVLLLVAKLATIAVPFTFKWATDALVGEGSAPVAPSSWLVWVFAAPIADDGGLWRHPHPDGGAHPGARRPVRQGGDARGAPARATAPSSTCTSCRCASIWSARPAG